MRLENWLFDETSQTISGRLSGHPQISDGAYVVFKAERIDWDYFQFLSGKNWIKLGKSFAESYYEGTDGEDWPWPNSVN